MKFFSTPALALLACGCVLSLANCRKEQNLPYKYEAQNLNIPDEPYNYRNPDLPDHMFNVKAVLADKVTDRGATLGRVLFYDPKLSLNNKIACASCHDQKSGFADPVAFSKGFDGGLTQRNAS